MLHFYGTLKGFGGLATRCGHKKTGLHTVAASWSGAISVDLFHNEMTGEDEYVVRQQPWHGAGVSHEIARGILGKVAE